MVVGIYVPVTRLYFSPGIGSSIYLSSDCQTSSLLSIILPSVYQLLQPSEMPDTSISQNTGSETFDSYLRNLDAVAAAQNKASAKSQGSSGELSPPGQPSEQSSRSLLSPFDIILGIIR